MVDFAEAQFSACTTLAWFLLSPSCCRLVLMNRTVHGRNAYAIGDNREAAVNAGIRVGPHMMINFMLIGFLAALSAWRFYSSSGSVNPNDGMLLRALGDHRRRARRHQADRRQAGRSSARSAASLPSSFCARGWAISARHRNVNLVIG
jgi:hypothetical protein